MRANVLFFLVFVVGILLRWYTLPSPLPNSWTPDSIVKFTAPIIDQVEHTDTKTVIRSGIWYIPVKGYAEIMPGDMVTFVGRVEPKVLLSRVTRIVMTEPTFEVVVSMEERELSLTEVAWLTLLEFREHALGLLEIWLSEPMSSLAAGILLGVKGQMPSDFYQDLVDTGTLHIVAASGYNVSVVAGVLMKMVARIVSRSQGIAIGVVGIVMYVLIAGASASVVRAGIMGSLTLIAFYFGRPAEARRLLWMAAAIMLLSDPLMIVDVGFQLSVCATAGLLYLEPWLRARFAHNFLSAYLYPTLAATLATIPIIWWHFGRVSWISPMVNILVLPVVPMIMGMSAGVVGIGLLSRTLGQIGAWLLYVPLWGVVAVIRWFGG